MKRIDLTLILSLICFSVFADSPPPNGGTPPPGSSSSQPSPDSGTQPLPDSGSQPLPDSGTQPLPDSGSQPPPDSETKLPPLDKDTQPLTPKEGDSKPLPPRNNGYKPPPDRGMAFLPPPEEDKDTTLPPPHQVLEKKLPPPPKGEVPVANVGQTKPLPPPPDSLPGTVTRDEELREQADLFHLNWQAQQTNIEEFTARFKVPTHRVLPRGEQVMIRVTNNEPIFYGTDTPVSTTIATIPPAAAANSDALWQLGLTGSQMDCVGVWDVGAVLTSHQEFNQRITQADVPNSTSDHSTHVAGTITSAGTDAMAQGVAYEGCLQAYDWENADSEIAKAAANGLTISNHSYGVMSGWVNMGTNGNKDKWCWYGNPNVSEVEDYKFGFYSKEAKNLDQIAYDAPYYLIVKAGGNDRTNNPTKEDLVDVDFDYSCDNFTIYTGNDQPGGDGSNDDGYDTLMPGSTAKNILTIGAVDDAFKVSDFSGWGPTDDGRIKPDLMAFGVGVYSTSSLGKSKYAVKDGTSMASPAVTASLSLIQQYYRNLNDDVAIHSATLKALALHTATDLGNLGPDYQTGWGYLNNPAMTEIISEQAKAKGSQFLHIYELSLGEGNTETIDLNIAPDTEQLRVTLVWHDVPGSSPTSSLDPTNIMLINDLDLRLIGKDGTKYLPWILDKDNPENPASTGDNNLDNVEQIRIDNPTAGNRSYTVQISHKNHLSDDYQTFSLVISGNSTLNDPAFDLRQNGILLANGNTFSFGTLAEGNQLEKTFTVYNRGSGTLKLSNFKISGDGFTLTEKLGVTKLDAGESTNFTVTASGKDSAEINGSFSLTVNNEDTVTIDLIAAVEAAGTVNDFGDSLVTDGKCSLREAIANANANSSVHADCPVTEEITLSSGIYTLSLTGIEEDANLTGDLDITRSLTIRGAGMTKTIIQAENSDRVLHVPESEEVNLNLQGLTLRGGKIAEGYGGGIHFDSSDGTLSLYQVNISENSAQYGGGLYVKQGTLAIAWSSIADNTATTESGNGGGGINCSLNCSLSLLNSAVVNNESGQFGGAIITETGSIQNSTISGNKALAGGGIIDTTSQVGTISLTNVTIYGNESIIDDYPSGLMLYKSNAEIKNSILAGNMSSGIANNAGNWNKGSGVITSLGNNLSDTNDWEAANGDLLDKDLSNEIALQALSEGTTLSHLPDSNSLALDAADCGTDYDQRGNMRTYGAGCDIGAVEVQADDSTMTTPEVQADDSTTTTSEVQADDSTTTTLEEDSASIPDWQRVMNWAEVIYPELFPLQDKQAMQIEPYEVRYYPGSDTYVGYNPNDNYFYGYNPAQWGDEIIKFGSLAEYMPLAEQGEF
jgi:hypothetical protein